MSNVKSVSKEAALPVRPTIPLPFHALVTCIFVERIIMAVRPGWLGAAIVSIALVAMAAFVAFRLKQLASHETLVVCLATAAATLIVATCAAQAAMLGTNELKSHAVSSFELEISSDMQANDSSFSGRCKVYSQNRLLGEARISCKELLWKGTRLRCVGRFTPPGDDSWGRALRSEGLLGSIKVVKTLELKDGTGARSVLEGWRRQKIEALNPGESDSQALVCALALGWRSDMKAKGLSDLFCACGISHVAAVSGTHVTVVCALVGSVLIRLRLSVRLRVGLLLALTGLFVLASGAAPSAIRAWLMCVSALSAHMAARRAHALSALSVCCLAMALIRPGLSGNIGFLLSLFCVASLCIYAGYATYVIQTLIGRIWMPRGVPPSVRLRLARLVRHLSQGFAVALVAALAALPITASAFGRLSLIGPVVNALLAAPFTVLVGLSVLAANSVHMGMAHHALMAAARLMGDALVALLKALASIPGSSVSIEADLGWTFCLVALGAAILYLSWPRVSRRVLGRVLAALCVICLAAFLRCRYFAPARICVLDVGQGDAILVQDASAAVLIDAGPDDRVARELERLGVAHLDALVITHLHDDHYGGTGALIGHVSCEGVFVGAGAAEHVPDGLASDIEGLTAAPAHEISYGDEIRAGDFTLKAIWPQKPAPGTENEDSLVMLVTYQGKNCGFTALLTGDAEHEALSECIRHESIEGIDLLKVGHHGSEVSLSAEDAARLKPRLAIASAGEGNSYGHPSAVCIEILSQTGSRFLCTKDVGTVIVEPQKGHLRVMARGSPHEVE